MTATAALQTTVSGEFSSGRPKLPSATIGGATPPATFRARCEALARLVREGRMGFIDAVDAAQNMAVAYGIVDEIGQDAVQEVIAEAFPPCVILECVPKRPC